MSASRALPSVVLITGTGTEVGKTVATAALASVIRSRGSTVSMVKVAQTGLAPGDPGDADEVSRLASSSGCRIRWRPMRPLVGQVYRCLR